MEPEQAKTLLMDGPAMEAATQSIAESLCEEFFKDGHEGDLAIIGIQRHGITLSSRLAQAIKRRTGFEPPAGTLDITMYRDDIGMRKTLPAIHETSIPFDINRRAILLVDDVLQTGRTIRAALDALTDYGRPRLIRLAVLIDRGMREFPVGADYAGSVKRVPADLKISVKWREIDGEDAVLATRKSEL